MPDLLHTLAVTILGGSIAVNWYLSQANDKIKESLIGRSLILEDDLKKRLAVLHARYRERMFHAPGTNLALESVQELRQRESLEQERWAATLEADWPTISMRFRHLYSARQASRTWCYFASTIAYVNIAVSILTLLAIAVGSYWLTWQSW